MSLCFSSRFVKLSLLGESCFLLEYTTTMTMATASSRIDTSRAAPMEPMKIIVALSLLSSSWSLTSLLLSPLPLSSSHSSVMSNNMSSAVFFATSSAVVVVVISTMWKQELY